MKVQFWLLILFSGNTVMISFVIYTNILMHLHAHNKCRNFTLLVIMCRLFYLLISIKIWFMCVCDMIIGCQRERLICSLSCKLCSIMNDSEILCDAINLPPYNSNSKFLFSLSLSCFFHLLLNILFDTH